MIESILFEIFPIEFARRLNRFRYGQPKPPHERESERKRLPLPSSTQKSLQRSSTPASSRKLISFDAHRKMAGKDAKSSQHSSPSSHKVVTTPLSIKNDKSNKDPSLASKDAVDINGTDTSITSLDSKLEKILYQR